MIQLDPLKSQNRKSFYGKAHIEETESTLTLYSYGSPHSVYYLDRDVFSLGPFVSQTTEEHLLAFVGRLTSIDFKTSEEARMYVEKEMTP